MTVLLASGCATITPPAPDDLKQAETLYSQNSDNGEYAFYYARALLHHERAKDAYQTLMFHIDSPDYSADQQRDIYTLMAGIHSALKNKQQAEDFYRKALALNPNDLTAQLNLVAHYRSHKKNSKAQNILDKTLYACGASLSQPDFEMMLDIAVLNLMDMSENQDAHDLILYGKSLYPDSRILERHERIIRALLQSDGHNAPKPAIKVSVKE